MTGPIPPTLVAAMSGTFVCVRGETTPIRLVRVSNGKAVLSPKRGAPQIEVPVDGLDYCPTESYSRTAKIQRAIANAAGAKPAPAQAERRMKNGKDPFEALWNRECELCGASPVVRATGMCGPCTFGEADTMGGNW